VGPLPEPPDDLSDLAKDEWRRVTPELHALGLLTVVDVKPLAAYCAAYAMWAKAERLLAIMEENDPATCGFVTRGFNNTLIVNPVIRVARTAANDMVKFAGEFGFTPVARTRIAAGIASDGRSKFDGMLD
jgi:P27 family predicted phage terminase small subunit